MTQRKLINKRKNTTGWSQYNWRDEDEEEEEDYKENLPAANNSEKTTATVDEADDDDDSCIRWLIKLALAIIDISWILETWLDLIDPI